MSFLSLVQVICSINNKNVGVHLFCEWWYLANTVYLRQLNSVQHGSGILYKSLSQTF